MPGAQTTEVGVGYVRLVPSMEGFGPDAAKGMGTTLSGPMTKAGQEAGRSFTTGLSTSLRNAGREMSDIGTKMTLGLTTPLVAFGIKAVKSASDLNESLNKSNVVFGTSGGVIENWAAGAADALGLSKKAALDAAGTFGNMFTQLGFSQSTTAGLSQNLVGLAADFSSFHNADITDVLLSMQSAFRGEYDPIQRFLPLMSAATVESEALAETHKKSAKELTAAEKAQAAYNLMLKGAGPALGDFARTADQDANATRRAAAAAENAAAAFGTKLLPIKRQLISAVGTLLERFNSLSPGMQKVVLYGALIVAALGPILSVVGPIISIIGVLAGLSPVVLIVAAAFIALAAVAVLVWRNWSTVHGWLMVLWGGLQAFWGWLQGAWSAVGEFLAGPLRTVGGFFQGLWGIAQDFYRWLADTFGPGLARIWSAIASNVGPIVDELGQTASALAGYWSAAWPVIQAIAIAIGDIFVWMGGVVADVWNGLYPVISLVVSLIVSTVQAGVGVLSAIWSAFWSLFGDLFMAAWNFVTRVLADGLAIVLNLIRFVLNIIQGDWSAAWSNLADIVRSIWDLVGAIFRLGWDVIVAVFVAGIGLIKDLFWVVAGFVADRAADIVGVLSGIWGRVSGAFGALRDGVLAVFTAMKDWASDRISDVVGFFAGLPGRVGSAISGIADTITGPFSKAFSSIRSLWNSTVGGFGFSVPSWVPIVGNKSFSIPKMHSGGIFAPEGYAPEGLAMLKRGEGVFTPDQMRAIGTTRTAPAPEVRNVVELHANGLDRALLEWLRGTVRAKGGNVQLVLGAGGAAR